MRSQWVLCCGEAVYDVTTTDARHLLAGVGGGPTYAALAIARAGMETKQLALEVALWAGIPRGIYGERIASTLRDGGVYTGYLIPTASPPTMALTSPRGSSVAYEIYAEGTSSFDVDLEDAPETAPDGSPFRLVHLGGLGTAIAPMADVLTAAVPHWAAEGALIGYDPNIRDGFSARGQGLAEVESWFRLADVAKVSTEDLEALYGSTNREHCVDRILQLGVRIVILTDGPGPVSAYTRTSSVSMPVEPWPEGVLPVGAGDAFISGVYAALLTAEELPDAAVDTDAALRAVLQSGLAAAARHARRERG